MNRRAWRAAALALAVLPGACTAPRQAEPTVRVQRAALERIAAAHLEDSAALLAMARATLAVARERALTAIEDDTVSRYIDAAGRADTQRLLDDVAHRRASALAREVVSGAMSPDEAESTLVRYAGAWARGDAAERRAVTASLPSVRAFDEAGAALLVAMGDRAQGVAALLADLGASVGALERFASAAPEARSIALGASAELWRRAVLARIDDEERREAGERLLLQAMGFGAALDGSGSTDEHEEAR